MGSSLSFEYRERLDGWSDQVGAVSSERRQNKGSVFCAYYVTGSHFGATVWYDIIVVHSCSSHFQYVAKRVQPIFSARTDLDGGDV